MLLEDFCDGITEFRFPMWEYLLILQTGRPESINQRTAVEKGLVRRFGCSWKHVYGLTKKYRALTYVWSVTIICKACIKQYRITAKNTGVLTEVG